MTTASPLPISLAVLSQLFENYRKGADEEIDRAKIEVEDLLSHEYGSSYERALGHFVLGVMERRNTQLDRAVAHFKAATVENPDLVLEAWARFEEVQARWEHLFSEIQKKTLEEILTALSRIRQRALTASQNGINTLDYRLAGRAISIAFEAGSKYALLKRELQISGSGIENMECWDREYACLLTQGIPPKHFRPTQEAWERARRTSHPLGISCR